MPFFKSKSLSQQVEERQEKLQLKQIALADKRLNSQMKAEDEKMRSAEMRRLRA